MGLYGKGAPQCRTGRAMKSSIFLLVLASASGAPQFEGLKDIFSALSGDDQPGEVNGDYEQVPYTTLKKFDGYEMRQYPSVKWVCTDVTYKMERDDSLSRDTNDFNLIKMVQEMMSGKAWKNKPENKMFETFQVHFWGEQGAGGGGDDCSGAEQDEVAIGGDGQQADVLLPQQEAPGQPTYSAVKIEQNKEFTVYVHQFGGYAMSDSVNLREARRFAEVLKSAGEEVDTELFYTAGYDSPMKFWNRRNEVMYLVPGNDL